MNDLKKQLEDFLSSDEGKEFIEQEQRKIVFMKEHYEKYVNKLNELSKEQRHELFNKIKAKYESNEYKDRWYKRGIFPPHNLYDYIYEYAVLYGFSIDELNIFDPKLEDGYIIDNNWLIIMIIGQGTEFVFCEIKDYKQ